jgi:Mitochondrial carrier protein
VLASRCTRRLTDFSCASSQVAKVFCKSNLPAGPWTDTVSELVAGGLAGCLAWASIYPLDVVKCRMQGQRQSMLQVLSRLRAEGPHAFVRGMRATLYRAFLVNAAVFYGYEVASQALSSSSVQPVL